MLCARALSPSSIEMHCDFSFSLCICIFPAKDIYCRIRNLPNDFYDGRNTINKVERNKLILCLLMNGIRLNSHFSCITFSPIIRFQQPQQQPKNALEIFRKKSKFCD